MRQFGLEIEFLSSLRHRDLASKLDRADLPVDHYATGQAHCPENCYSGWQVKTDGSIHITDSHFSYRTELVSPPLTLKNHKAIVKAVKIASIDGMINRSCGLHVHVAAPELWGLLELNEHLSYLTSAWESVEQVFYSYVSPSRRYNSYCKPGISLTDKYRGLNIIHLNGGDEYGTLEFRMHQASLNPEKIITFALLCEQFVSHLVKKLPLQPLDPNQNISMQPHKIRTKKGKFELHKTTGINDKWVIELKGHEKHAFPDLQTAFLEMREVLGIRASNYLRGFRYPSYGNAMTELCSLLGVSLPYKGLLEDRYDSMVKKHGTFKPGLSTTSQTGNDEADFYNEVELAQ